LFFADAFCRALEIGKPILMRLLMCANEKVSELSARRAGLRQQLRDSRLQEFV
jgi:hypothetical protein